MSKVRRKAKMPEEEPDEGDAWLLSYSDMMTLVACFFILMMAFANYDPKGFQEKTKEVSKHFSKGQSKISNLKMTELKEEIAKHPELKDMTKITVNDSSLVISLSGSILFPDNEVDMKPQMVVHLDSMIDIIKTFNTEYNIIVEGHSDNLPLGHNNPYKNHWALAGARASSVAERFQYFGFPNGRIRVISHGDSKPIAANQDKNGKPIRENNLLNRRVVIKVVEPLDKRASVKMGLGVYFEPENLE